MIRKMLGAGMLCMAFMFVVTLTMCQKKAAEVTEYKVGAVFSVTGRASFLGDPEKKTADMIVEQVNQAGGINGKPLKLIVYDDEGDATKCNLQVKKLLEQDKVSAVIGPSISGSVTMQAVWTKRYRRGSLSPTFQPKAKKAVRGWASIWPRQL